MKNPHPRQLATMRVHALTFPIIISALRVENSRANYTVNNKNKAGVFPLYF
jgi:hypothetical protein